MPNGIFEDLLARGEHQRTDDPAHLRRDARQPAQPRAAQQVDEELEFYNKRFETTAEMERTGESMEMAARRLG